MSTPLLDYDSVAALIGFHPVTLRRLVAAGRGPRALKIGRSVRFREIDVTSWLDSLTARPKPRRGRPKGSRNKKRDGQEKGDKQP